MEQVIYGKIPSKSNSYRIVTINGHGSLAKTPALKQYEQAFYLQCNKYRGKDLKCLFELDAAVYYENNRPDLDNCFKILLDCLQSCKAIRNDRQCVKITAAKYIDPHNPRVEFTINPALPQTE